MQASWSRPRPCPGGSRGRCRSGCSRARSPPHCGRRPLRVAVCPRSATRVAGPSVNRPDDIRLPEGSGGVSAAAAGLRAGQRGSPPTEDPVVLAVRAGPGRSGARGPFEPPTCEPPGAANSGPPRRATCTQPTKNRPHVLNDVATETLRLIGGSAPLVGTVAILQVRNRSHHYPLSTGRRAPGAGVHRPPDCARHVNNESVGQGAVDTPRTVLGLAALHLGPSDGSSGGALAVGGGRVGAAEARCVQAADRAALGGVRAP
ncbi:hypothetical protein SAMN05216371_0053 [Streptomyces sp. TLI_053]|nr:hypothetical protein SAMN05216371_0053 [Streptomyces sp. TLI_053]